MWLSWISGVSRLQRQFVGSMFGLLRLQLMLVSTVSTSFPANNGSNFQPPVWPGNFFFCSSFFDDPKAFEQKGVLTPRSPVCIRQRKFGAAQNLGGSTYRVLQSCIKGAWIADIFRVSCRRPLVCLARPKVSSPVVRAAAISSDRRVSPRLLVCFDGEEDAAFARLACDHYCRAAWQMAFF